MKYTIWDMENSTIQFKKTHTVNINGVTKTNGAPSWFIEFKKENDERWARQEQFNQKQLEFNQFITDQFKKHGWIK